MAISCALSNSKCMSKTMLGGEAAVNEDCEDHHKESFHHDVFLKSHRILPSSLLDAEHRDLGR